MTNSNRATIRMTTAVCALLTPFALGGSASAADMDTGTVLPPGFSATIFADNLGHTRQMAIAADGTLYVNSWSGVYYKADDPKLGGFLIALKDTKGDGHADKVERFGSTFQTGGHGGTGIAVYKDGLYAEINDQIVRYSLKDGVPKPSSKPTTVVSGVPITGDHPMTIDAKGDLYVNIASATNACQSQNRVSQSAGESPAPKKTRAAVYGVSTPTSPIRRFRRRPATSAGSATVRGSPSTRTGACSRLSTVATSSTRTGLSSTKLNLGINCPRRNWSK